MARFKGLEFHHVAQDSNYRQRTSLLEWAPNAIPTRPTRLWKGSLSHLWYGRTREEIPSRTRSYPQSTKHNTNIIRGSATKITPSAHVIMVVIAPWAETFLTYLTSQELPDDQNEARRIVRRSKAYKVHEGELYKKSATGVLQRCISKEEGRQLLAEIHAGLGGHHIAAQALISKAFHTGFFWPMARADAQALVQRCMGCQLFTNQSLMPPTALRTIPLTWPSWCGG